MAILQRGLGSIVRSNYRWLRNATTYLLFERRLGVQTSGEIELEKLGIAAEGRIRYQPTGLLQFRRILPSSAVGADDVFLDIGCGKGRVVLLAAGYSFRRVIGIELSPELTAIARQNIARCENKLRCKDVEIINHDAVDYEIPDDVTVVFMFNPVTGSFFSSVVENILASYDRRPRAMRIIYVNPREEATLLSTGRIRLAHTVHGLRPGREWSRSNSVKLYTVQPVQCA